MVVLFAYNSHRSPRDVSEPRTHRLLQSDESRALVTQPKTFPPRHPVQQVRNRHRSAEASRQPSSVRFPGLAHQHDLPPPFVHKKPQRDTTPPKRSQTQQTLAPTISQPVLSHPQSLSNVQLNLRRDESSRFRCRAGGGGGEKWGCEEEGWALLRWGTVALQDLTYTIRDMQTPGVT
jgi:hypothetical protein